MGDSRANGIRFAGHGWRRVLSVFMQPLTGVALLTLLAIVLRLIGIESRSLWGDELFTIAHAMGSVIRPETLAQLGHGMDPTAPQTAGDYISQYFTRRGEAMELAPTLRALMMNNHPPLYFWLIRLTVDAWGLTPLALRLPSLLASAGCVPLLFLLGRRLHSAPVGVIAAAMMALSGYQVFHAQDARPYALLTLIALAALGLLVKTLDEALDDASMRAFAPRQLLRWLGWTLLCVAGLYTHYFFAPFCVFMLLYGVIRAWRAPRTLLALMISVALAAACVYPWLSVLKAQAHWISQEGHFTGGRWDWIQAPEIIWRMLCEYIAPKSPWLRVALPILLIYGMGVMFYVRRSRWTISRLTLCCLVWIACIEGFMLAYDVTLNANLLSVRRYGMLAAPAFYLLIACVIVNIKTRERLIQPAILTGLLGWMLLNSLWITLTHGLTGGDYREAASYIVHHHAGGRETVLVNPSGPPVMGMAFYLPAPTPLLGLPARSMFTMADRQAVESRVKAAMAQSSRIWVVYSDSAPSAQLFIDRALTAQQFLPGDQQRFEGVQLSLYERFDPRATRRAP